MGGRVKAVGPGRSPVVVLKFGSSVLEGADGFAAAAREVAREVEEGRRVVAVVSAPPGSTDDLLRSAGALTRDPPERLVSRLLATGECASVALLGIALAARGLEAALLDPRELGLRARGPVLDSDPVDLDVRGLLGVLADSEAVVVPGFVGVGPDGGFRLLGRGGSDLTALFLADRLQAVECRLLKDVDGVYAADPRTQPSAPVFLRASWDVVLEVGGEIVQPKAVRFARARGRSFRVCGFGGVGTVVGEGPSAGGVRGPAGHPPLPRCAGV